MGDGKVEFDAVYCAGKIGVGKLVLSKEQFGWTCREGGAPTQELHRKLVRTFSQTSHSLVLWHVFVTNFLLRR
eukprot:6398534-Amphidinium_carterae.2